MGEKLSKGALGSFKDDRQDELNALLSPEQRYRAKIASVTPARAREIIEQRKTCFLGVSLENKKFSTAKTAAMLDWIDTRCNQAAILIGDSIHAKTLQIRTGLVENEAKNQALALGERAQKRIFSQTENRQCEYKIIKCSQVQEHPEYQERYDAIKKEFVEDIRFNTSVSRFAQEFVKRTVANEPGPPGDPDKLALSIEYFLEEFAVFSCLVEQDLDIMVYPGAFSSLREMVEGKFSVLQKYAPAALFELSLRRR